MSWPTTHGATHTPEYRTWAGMMQRCRNPNNCRYPRYGGRGISVCERWLDASKFLADMGPRPSSQYSLDRIDNAGNYHPANCRWATRSEQQRNKSKFRPDHLIPRGDAHWTRRDGERARAVARENIAHAHKKGDENGNAKIDSRIAESMRHAHAEDPTARMADLGKRFGVGRETARKVIRGLAW